MPPSKLDEPRFIPLRGIDSLDFSKMHSSNSANSIPLSLKDIIFQPKNADTKYNEDRNQLYTMLRARNEAMNEDLDKRTVDVIRMDL